MNPLSKSDNFPDTGSPFTLKVESLELSCRRFTAPTPCGISLIYCHGMQSHQKWFTDSAEDFRSRGFDVTTWDRLGSGDSQDIEGLRGHMTSYRIHLESLRVVIQKVREDNPGNKIILWGNSYGGKLIAAFSGKVDGLIFSTPGIFLNKERMKLPFSIPRFLLSRNKTYYPSIIPEAGDDQGASMFTANENYFIKIKYDPKSLRSFTRQFYLETSKLDRYVQKNCRDINIPTLLLLVADDGMMDNDKIQSFFKKRFRNLKCQVFQTDQKHQHYLMFTNAREKAFGVVESFMKGLP